MAKNKKIIRYRKPLNINVGMIIFAMIFVYLSFSVYTYISRDKIQFYEVVEGSIVNDKNYTGFILREEAVKTAAQTGHVNFYIREGKRVAAGARVYSVDETGQLAKFLQENRDAGGALPDDGLAALKRQLSSFCLSYSDGRFGKVYDEKYSLQASVAEYANFQALDGMEELLEERGIRFEQVYSDEAGIVSYALDSYEDTTASDVTEALFDRSAYRRSVNRGGEMVESGTPLYKLITSEDWSVVFPLREEDLADFSGADALSIAPSGSTLTLRGRFSQISGSDGKIYGRLDFDKYMVQFVSDRFLDFEVVTEEAAGLKIPVSSVTTKDFYTIPAGYLTQGGDGTYTESGFNKEVYSESGEPSVVFTTAEIYNLTDGYYYVDKSDTGPFKSGDYIIKPDSDERFQVGPTATLKGVYNINKGYAVFKQITELAGNGEYYIIEKGTGYGLSVYDHIVLDAGSVQDGQIIYQ